MGEKRLKLFEWIYSKGNSFLGNVSSKKLTENMIPLDYTKKTKLRTTHKLQMASHLISKE